jgi:hypothetical protein
MLARVFGFPRDFEVFGPFRGYLGGSIMFKPACGCVVLA